MFQSLKPLMPISCSWRGVGGGGKRERLIHHVPSQACGRRRPDNRLLIYRHFANNGIPTILSSVISLLNKAHAKKKLIHLGRMANDFHASKTAKEATSILRLMILSQLKIQQAYWKIKSPHPFVVLPGIVTSLSHRLHCGYTRHDITSLSRWLYSGYTKARHNIVHSPTYSTVVIQGMISFTLLLAPLWLYKT